MTTDTQTDFASLLDPTAAPDQAQWVQLLPLGAARPMDGRSAWTIDDPDQIIAASAAALARGMPVDFDHAMEGEGRSAPAAGWIEQLEKRVDGIWGLIRWTSKGHENIAGRVYRYISPVFNHDKKSGRITQILRAGLTNTPALEMTAICAAETTASPQTTPPASPPVDILSLLPQIGALMGLPDTTDPMDVLKALFEALAGRTATAQTKGQAAQSMGPSMVPVEYLATMVQTQDATLKAMAVETRVKEAARAGRLPPALHDMGRVLCAFNPDIFDAFVRNSAVNIATDFSHLSGPRFATDGQSRLTDAQKIITDRLGLSGDVF